MLSINKLSVLYGKTPALEDVTGAAVSGELTVLAGPNGAGKTTLLKAVTGQAELQNGSISLDSKEIDPADDAWRDMYSYTAADSGVLPILTVEEQLDLLCRLTGEDGETSIARTAGILELLELKGHRNYRGDELSSGLTKRLQIGLGIIRDVPVYLFDEPFNGLDAKSITVLQKILSTLIQRNRYIVIASHILHLLEGFPITLWEFKKGRLAGIFRGSEAEKKCRELSALLPQHEAGNILPWIR